jgi:cytochrome c oxidase cbb3-type subunit 3
MKAPSAQLTGRLKRDIATKWVRAACIFVFSLYTSATSAEESQLEQGKSLYEFYCYQCHAYSGNANTVAATYLNPKPRDFTRANSSRLTREQMLRAVQHGKPGTAMTSFARVLSSEDMAAVVDYVRSNLMGSQRPELAYHTLANGWENHQRYESAFVFALGTVPIDTAWEDLSPKQRIGRQLFLSACITCHESRRVNNEPLKFEPRAVSYPRSTDTCIDCHAARPRELLPFSAARPNALTDNKGAESPPRNLGASPYLKHGRPKLEKNLSESELRGKELFLANCAFCHAADGSSKNWIGSLAHRCPAGKMCSLKKKLTISSSSSRLTLTIQWSQSQEQRWIRSRAVKQPHNGSSAQSIISETMTKRLRPNTVKLTTGRNARPKLEAIAHSAYQVILNANRSTCLVIV